MLQALHISPGRPLANALHHLLCATLLLALNVSAESGRIVKWKDEKGVTHYGDKIPAQYSQQENSLLNKQGVTVQKNKTDNPRDTEAEQAKLEQEKKDKALLGTYSSAAEIDLARDRNLEVDTLALNNLQLDRTAALKKLNASKSLAESYRKAKKPIPAHVQSEVDTNTSALTKIDQRISERQLTISNIHQRFANDKTRYLQLRGMEPTTP